MFRSCFGGIVIMLLITISIVAVFAAGPVTPPTKVAPPTPVPPVAVVEPAQPDQASLDSAREIAEVSNALGFNLMNNFQKTEKSSFVFSPLSIEMALGIANYCADTTTKDGITKAAGFGKLTSIQINGDNNKQIMVSKKPEAVVNVGMANGVWLPKDTKFVLPNLAGEFQLTYNSNFECVDLSTPDSAKTMNDWITAQTTTKNFTDMLKPADFTPATSIVMANAMNVQAPWVAPFDKALTKDADFTTATGKIKKVPMMSKTLSTDYLENDNMQYVNLFLGKNARLCMDIIIPKPGKKFSDVGFSAENWSKWQGSCDSANLTLKMPQLKISDERDMKNSLSKMGMQDAFDTKTADFSVITGAKGLILSVLRHKSVLNVDELGVGVDANNAAVAPALTGKTTAVTLNRPFVVLIYDTASSTILSMGVVNDPQP